MISEIYFFAVRKPMIPNATIASMAMKPWVLGTNPGYMTGIDPTNNPNIMLYIPVG